MKKYKLLKDLPYCKAGTIFIEKFGKYESEDNNDWTFKTETIESSSEWFEEVKEDKVKEFKKKIHNYYYNFPKNPLEVKTFDNTIDEFIKDDGKEEVTKKMKMYFEKYMGYVGEDDHRIIDNFLENYIIIKV